MHSDSVPATESTSRWTWLRSQGLGICCGLATVLLLAIGSFVIAATRDGASAGVRLDDVRVFFLAPSPVHLWLYLLLPVLGLYGLNTALATWHSITVKWRNGVREPAAYAAAVIHAGFLVSLIAHLVGGIAGDTRGLLLDGNWRPLPDGREARVVSVDVESLPGGMPKTMRANLEVRSGDDTPTAAFIGYNEPLSSGLGAHLVLLQRPVTVPAAAVLTDGGEWCSVRPGQRCLLGGREVGLADLRDGGGHGILARVFAEGRETWLEQGVPQPFAPRFTVTLMRVENQPGAFATTRYAPGNPWALAAALLVAIGVALMWRRLV